VMLCLLVARDYSGFKISEFTFKLSQDWNNFIRVMLCLLVARDYSGFKISGCDLELHL